MSLVTWKPPQIDRNSGTRYGYIDGRLCISVFWRNAGWKVDTHLMNTNKVLAQMYYPTKEDACQAAVEFAARWVARLAKAVTEPLSNPLDV